MMARALLSILPPLDFARRYAFGPGPMGTWLDGLAALRERELVEEETPQLLGKRLYLEPFALRALGAVREDDELVQQAQRRFHALGLSWHAGQTPAILGE